MELYELLEQVKQPSPAGRGRGEGLGECTHRSGQDSDDGAGVSLAAADQVSTVRPSQRKSSSKARQGICRKTTYRRTRAMERS